MNTRFISKSKIFLCGITILLFSCKEYVSPIPEYPVYLEFNIIAYAPELAAYGGVKEFVEPTNASQRLGFGGIVVFHAYDDRFYAFDMACPYEIEPNIKVHTDNTGVARCNTCQSAFYVADGTGFLMSGKAKSPLKKYRTYCTPTTNNLLVTN
jgi:nitrite reductase/ring-hydroxylating ferredoxin subunit